MLGEIAPKMRSGFAVPNQLTVGNLIGGGTSHAILYTDGNNNLASTSGFTFSGGLGGYMIVPSIYCNSYLGSVSADCQLGAGGSASHGVAIQGIASQTAPLLKLQNLSLSAASRSCGIIDATFNTSTDASWSGNLLLYAGDYTSSNAGKRLGVQIQSNGTQALVGLFGATPVVQPVGGGNDVTNFVAGAGTAVTSLSTWTGATGASTYTIGDIVTALKKLGALAP